MENIMFKYQDMIRLKEVENVCPNSELWWFALFLGVIWPLLTMNNVKSAVEKNGKDDANIFFVSQRFKHFFDNYFHEV